MGRTKLPAFFAIFIPGKQEQIDPDDDKRKHGQDDDERDAQNFRIVGIQHILRDDGAVGGVVGEAGGIGAVAVVIKAHLHALRDGHL